MHTPCHLIEQEAWKVKPEPNLRSASRSEISDEVPRLGVLVTTETERIAVSKRLSPPKGRRAILRVFEGTNTFFIGRLGTVPVAVCMCASGASGRDASLVVTSELIDTWSVLGVIMVGIAFGKDAALQRIGNVLISDRVIAYEPERVGSEERRDRGDITQAGALLLNRFRNVMGWNFEDPHGAACGFQVGPLLSGEKLVDNKGFKGKLFARFPDAIGGEMEGAGVAAAERKKCEWILVKSISVRRAGTTGKRTR